MENGGTAEEESVMFLALNRIPIVRVCAEDGEIIKAFLLKPGDHIDITLTKEQQKRKPARLVCDG